MLEGNTKYNGKIARLFLNLPNSNSYILLQPLPNRKDDKQKPIVSDANKLPNQRDPCFFILPLHPIETAVQIAHKLLMRVAEAGKGGRKSKLCLAPRKTAKHLKETRWQPFRGRMRASNSRNQPTASISTLEILHN